MRLPAPILSGEASSPGGSDCPPVYCNGTAGKRPDPQRLHPAIDLPTTTPPYPGYSPGSRNRAITSRHPAVLPVEIRSVSEMGDSLYLIQSVSVHGYSPAILAGGGSVRGGGDPLPGLHPRWDVPPGPLSGDSLRKPDPGYLNRGSSVAPVDAKRPHTRFIGQA